MIALLISNALWQGAVIVGCALIVLRLVPSGNPTTRYAAWFLTLFALFIIPMASAGVHFGLQLLPAPLPHAAPTSGRFSLVALAPLASDAASWLSWPSTIAPNIAAAIAVLWIAGAMVGLVRLAASFGRIARVRRAARPLLWIEGVPVLTSRRLSIPIATGILSPAVIVPEELAGALRREELQCTLEHELAHLRRRDVATNAIQRIVEALLFWNPWIYLVGRHLVIEREAACDDWAVCRLGEDGDYVGTLAELGRRLTRSGAPLLTPSAFASKTALVARIERLVSGRPIDLRLNYLALGGLAMLFAVITALAQMLVLAPAQAAGIVAHNGSIAVAVSCKNPNSDVAAINPVAPQLPKPQWPSHPVAAIVSVTVTATGKAAAARIYHSSGDANVDRAVVAAAEKSTYSPKLVNCAPVQSTYLFKADFGP